MYADGLAPRSTCMSFTSRSTNAPTALEKAESARRVAEEAGHLKDEFLATASHELRTPLNAIVGWVHVLQSGALPDDEQRQQAVNAIERNAKIQTRLIEDLLDVSRMIQGRVSLTVSPLDLRESDRGRRRNHPAMPRRQKTSPSASSSRR